MGGRKGAWKPFRFGVELDGLRLWNGEGGFCIQRPSITGVELGQVDAVKWLYVLTLCKMMLSDQHA